MDLNVSGIYKITSKSQGKCYIGSSINIDVRWKSHKRELRGNYHGNKYLQNIYNKYGIEDLVFEVVMVCEPEELLIFEEQQIQTHNSFHEGLNLVEMPTRNFNNGKLTEIQVNEVRQKFFDGERITTLAKQYDIHRKTMRECIYLKTYQHIPCNIEGYNEMLKTLQIARENGGRPRSRGWKQSQEHIEKMRKINSKPKKTIRKLTDEQVREIRKMSANGSTYKEIAELFPVNQMSISKIVRRITYAEVK